MTRSLIGRLSHRMRGDDEGFALILVLGTMLALSLVIAAGLEYSTHALKSSRHEQDFGTSIAAVQAGAEDFQHHLNVCDDYWQGTASNCYTAFPTNPALLPAGQVGGPTAAQWAAAPHIPGTSASPSPGTYLYEVLGGPFTPGNNGAVKLQVWGRSGSVTQVTRTAVVSLSKASLLKYIYFTDIEAVDPSTIATQYAAYSWGNAATNCNGTYVTCNYQGVTAATAQLCNHYHYDSAAYGTGRNNNDTISEAYSVVNNKNQTSTGNASVASCDIQFGGGDKINGPLHSNDALDIGTGGVTFTGTAETGWSTTSNPAPSPLTQLSWGSGTISGNQPVTSDVVPLPTTNNSIQTQAAIGSQGCLYTGPTQITLNSNSTMTVVSPNTKATNSGCSTSLPITNAETVALPKNGVVYVQSIPGTGDPNYSATPARTTAPYTGVNGYPQALDNGWAVGSYTASTGDAYVSGTLNGQLTIAAANNIAVVNNLVYNDTSATSDDVLGLVAQNFVEAYHPVNCAAAANQISGANYDAAEYGATSRTTNCTNLTPPGATGPLTNLTIDAAILSVAHSFRVQNYDLGPQLGTLSVQGSIIQKFRGPVALSGTTGYVKSYSFDSRLQQLPPPFFLNPQDAPWQISTFDEQQS